MQKLPFATSTHLRGRRAEPRAEAPGGDRIPWPVVAPFLVTVAALPLLRPSGPANSSPLVDLPMALAIWAAFLWALRTRIELQLPYFVGAALLVLGGAIGAIAGPMPGGGVIDVVQDVLLLAWCATVVNLTRSARVLGLLLRTWACSGTVWAALLVALYASGNLNLAGVTAREGVRASLTFGDPNMAASYFVLAVVAVAAARYPRSRPLRTCAYAILLAALFLTGSNGAALAIVVITSVVALLHVTRTAGAPAAIAMGCAFVFVGLIVFASPVVSDVRLAARDSGIPILRDSVGRDNSLDQREILVEESYQLLQRGAPWGLGPRTTKPLLTDTLAPYAKESHDDYVESLTERGVIGAIGLLVLIVSIAMRTLAVARGPLATDFRLAVPNVAPLIGGVAAIAVDASYYQVQHFRHVWTLLAIIAGIQLWGLAKRRAPCRPLAENVAPRLAEWGPSATHRPTDSMRGHVTGGTGALAS